MIYREERSAASFRLFDRHGFRQVSRLVDIATAPHRDVVSEKLQRNDLE
jgi:hypothetical protein